MFFFMGLHHHIAPKTLELLRHKNANCAPVAATPQPARCDGCDPLESAGPGGAPIAGLSAARENPKVPCTKPNKFQI